MVISLCQEDQNNLRKRKVISPGGFQTAAAEVIFYDIK